MAYQKTTWVNDQAPAINASNLNKMEQGIADAETTVTQTETNTSGYDSYEFLFSGSADSTTHTEGVKKSERMSVNFKPDVGDNGINLEIKGSQGNDILRFSDDEEEENPTLTIGGGGRQGSLQLFSEGEEFAGYGELKVAPIEEFESREYTLPNKSGTIAMLDDIENAVNTKVYGFRIDGSESDPSDMVSYIMDAGGKTPAHMNYSTDKFDYGSWQDAFFMPRPCILSQSGTVMKYLDPNDFTKDVNGNTVAIDSGLTGANVMIEFPKIWCKVVPDAGDDKSGSVYISNKKVDDGYKDYAYIDYQGIHKEHFYMPAYNGSLVDGVLRSISGAQVMKTKNASQEVGYAQANGNGWYTEDVGEITLINFLLILMGKSVDTQTVFGQGLHTGGSEAINDGFRTGVHNTKGMFYGTNSGTVSSGSYGNVVKVFGIENYWGFQWRRYAGDINASGTRKIKMCWGTEDGSTTSSFNYDGSGYVDVGATPSGTLGGYISQMKFTANGMFSKVSSGSASTYYCDGQWFNNGQTDYALRGGRSDFGSLVGAFCVDLARTASGAWWYFGAAPSFK